MFAWMVFIGAAALWRGREHFAVDLVPDLFGRTWAATPLRVLLAALGLAFAGALTWYGSVFVWRTTSTTPILALPQAWVYTCIPIAGAIMVVYACRDLIAVLRRPRRPDRVPTLLPDPDLADAHNPLTCKMDRHAL